MFTRHKFLLLTVKELFKLVLNYRSYPQKVGVRFWTTLYSELSEAYEDEEVSNVKRNITSVAIHCSKIIPRMTFRYRFLKY